MLGKLFNTVKNAASLPIDVVKDVFSPKGVLPFDRTAEKVEEICEDVDDIAGDMLGD